MARNRSRKQGRRHRKTRRRAQRGGAYGEAIKAWLDEVSKVIADQQDKVKWEEISFAEFPWPQLPTEGDRMITIGDKGEDAVGISDRLQHPHEQTPRGFNTFLTEMKDTVGDLSVYVSLENELRKGSDAVTEDTIQSSASYPLRLWFLSNAAKNNKEEVAPIPVLIEDEPTGSSAPPSLPTE